MTIPENGYLAVYLSNASDFAGCSSCLASEGDVYFDHLEITFTHGHLKEENGYYPFGLPMAGQSSSALGMTPNRQKYQSNEYITEAGLNWMSFGARQYACPERSRRNPQLGRFLSVDPLAAAGGQESNSPYEAMGDEPVSETNPGGMLVDNSSMPPKGSNVSLGIQFAPSTLDIIFGSGSISLDNDESTSDVLDNTDWGNSGNTASAESMGIDIAGIFIDIDDGGTGFSSGIAMDEGPGGAAGDGAPDDKGNGGDPQSDNGNNKSPLQDMKDNPPNHPDYKAPKSGARKVRNPNGQGTGWLARDGRVWVPTDHKGTNHAPHYDVETPGTNGRRGPHVNIYPSVSPVIQVGIGVGIGIAIWETIKWGGAILGAPETGGASLGLLALP